MQSHAKFDYVSVTYHIISYMFLYVITSSYSTVDVSFRTRTLGELYERDGHTYVRLTKLEIEPKVGDMRIYASGLVPDPALSEYTNL